MDNQSNEEEVLLNPTLEGEEERGHDPLDSFRNEWRSELMKKTEPPRRVCFADDVKAGPSRKKSDAPKAAKDLEAEDENGKLSQSKDAEAKDDNSSEDDEILTPTVPRLGVFNNGPSMSSKLEERAKEWFEEGVIFEQKGKLYEAVNCYRKATQLVPDIEFKLYKKMAPKLVNNPGTLSDDIGSDLVDNGTNGFIELFTKLCINNENNFILCTKNEGSDLGARQQHISILPFEVLIEILKNVVFTQNHCLDLKSLENISLVCRGFYILARDEEIWKHACHFVWGTSHKDGNTSNLNGNEENISQNFPQNISKSPKLSEFLHIYDNSWRHMFICKPRVNYSGVYISRTTYIRQGESSFLDKLSSDYRPVHLVEYFRYLRFFPNGIVLMMTSNDEPIACIPKLRDPIVIDNQNRKIFNKISGNEENIFESNFFMKYLSDADNISLNTSPADNNYLLQQPPSVIQGVYQLIEPSSIALMFKRVTFDTSGSSSNYRRRGNRRANVIRTEQLYKMELNIKSIKNKDILVNNNNNLVNTKFNQQLSWKSYVIEYEKSSSNGIRVVSHFDTLTQPNKFPSFWYSKVKSYN